MVSGPKSEVQTKQPDEVHHNSYNPPRITAAITSKSMRVVQHIDFMGEK
jgi:hypothetical protein